MPIPLWAYPPTVLANTVVGQSANLSIVVSVVGFEGFFNVQCHQASVNISAGPEVSAYRGTGGGATYATQAGPSGSVVRNPNGQDVIPLRLEGGNWVIRIISGGGAAGSAWSFAIGTYDVVTAVA